MKTAILIPDKGTCEKVQRKLFEGGIDWRSGDEKIHDWNINTLIIDNNDPIMSWHGDDGLYDTIIYVEEHGYTIITADKFLADPTIIPCWKKPEPKMIEVKGKKYSEDTLHEAMKQYVNK